MSWIPPPPDATPIEGLNPWLPKALAETEWAGHVDGGMAYVVVDELHDEIAGLVLTPWPRVDDRGRLHFGDDEVGVRVATPSAKLRELLRTQRVPITPIPTDDEEDEELAGRPIAVGDVYGARLPDDIPPGGGGGGGGAEASPVPPEDLFDGPVLDLTAIAREVAKAQTNAAALGVMDEAVLNAIGEELGEDEEPPEPTPQGGTPTDNNPPSVPPKAKAQSTEELEAHAEAHVHHHHLEDLAVSVTDEDEDEIATASA